MRIKVIDYVPRNKSLPLIVGILTVTAFILGVKYSNTNGYYEQSVVPETKFFTIFETKVDTVYLKEKVKESVINEDAYGDRNYGHSIRTVSYTHLTLPTKRIV